MDDSSDLQQKKKFITISHVALKYKITQLRFLCLVDYLFGHIILTLKHIHHIRTVHQCVSRKK